MNKEQKEKELRGFYRTGCFHMYMNGTYHQNFRDMTIKDLGTFVHEYIHFLQNITTPFGLFEAIYQNNARVAAFIDLKDKEKLELPYKPDLTGDVASKLDWISFMKGESVPEEGTTEVVDLSSNIYAEPVPYRSGDGHVGFGVIVYFKCKDGKVHKRRIGALDIKESMAATYQSYIDPSALHPDIPYNLLYYLCQKQYPNVAADKKKYICICYMALFSQTPANSFMNLCLEAEENPQKMGFQMFDEFVNRRTFSSQGESSDVRSMMDYLVDGYKQSIAGMTLVEIPYISNLLDKVKLGTSNLPLLNVLNDDRSFSIEHIVALVSYLGVPLIQCANNQWVYPADNGKGTPDVVRLVGATWLYQFLTEKRPHLIGACPLAPICGDTYDFCHDSPWVCRDCSFELMGEMINLKDKKVKISYK